LNCLSLCRWNASADNGSHIIQYILEYDEGKDEGFVEVFKSRGKQHNLTKLQASTCYKFRLAAVNAYGKRYVAISLIHFISTVFLECIP
jgi:hypothetical protein